MIKFILGKSGTGKTTLIYEKLSKLSENAETPLLFLVPDQSTFQTEKDLLEILGAKKSRNVLVAGFSKLCRYVFEQTGNTPVNVIDDGTRAVIMSLALEQLTEKLDLLKTKNNKSMSELMLQTLIDCKKSGVTPEILRESAFKVDDPTLYSKLTETALVLDTYEALISQSYIDPLDDLERVFNILSENNLFKNFTIFVDSFSGFTLAQIKVLRLLLNQSDSSYISFTLDPLSNGNEEVFATSHKTYKLLKEIAKRDFIEIKTPVTLTENKRFSNNELSLLESGIFRNDFDASEVNPKNITLFSATDSYSECEFVARQIKKLITQEDYLYSDISIICHDTNPYRGIIDTILEKYEIPYFMDSEKDIEVKPVIRFVASIFKIILDDFERDDILSLLKTGLTRNTEDEINTFENYLYVWNVNNSAFKSEFINNPKGFSESFSQSDSDELAIVEKVRKGVIEPLIEFKNLCKNKNGKEITELLYKLLCTLGVPESLQEMYDILEHNSEATLAAEQIRIWNMLMEVMDKTVAVIGESYLTLKRYYELLSLQITNLKLSDIPQTLDSVTVTTAQRVRLSKQKASFLIGCTDGVFPATPHSSGIFSQFELKILANNEVVFGESFSELADLETFMAYCCMTSASHKIYASFPNADLLGNGFLPSAIISEIVKIYPEIITLDNADYLSPLNSMWAELPAFEECARAFSQNKNGLKSLTDYFDKNPKYSSKINSVLRAIDGDDFVINDTQNATLLFGENLRISASQVEKFSLCRFAYFCNYGLRVRERMRAEINPMEYGTLVHYLLEKFFTKYDKNSYSAMTDEDIEKFVKENINIYIEQYFGGAESKTNAFLYKLSVLKQNATALVKHIAKELSQSDFEVADCELNIGNDIPAYTVKLPTGQNIAICGSVDRVDIMKKNGITYLRVVDYKTGSKKFKLSDILYGLNMQMLIYLYSTQLNGTNRYGDIIPAGILYMPATTPIISADKNITAEQIEKELDKSLKMNGLLLDDIDVVKGMDKTEAATYIPVKIKADTPVGDSSLATLEQFGKIFTKLDKNIIEMGNCLYNGQIQASPTSGATDACEYCPYDSVCAYRKSTPRNTFELKNDEVYEKIDNEGGLN